MQNNPLDLDIEKMSKEELVEYLNLVDNMEEHQKYNSRAYLTPNEPQVRFWTMGSSDFKGDEINAGGEKTQRAFFACNRGGKSFAAAWELSYHVTGDYDEYERATGTPWPGKRYDKPIKAIVASNTEEQTWLVCMGPLIGTDNRKNEELLGTGMIPKEKFIWESCVGNRSGFREIAIRHASGGISTVRFAEYGKGAQALQGPAWDLIWLDEDCPEEIHHELGIRLITTKGHMLLTFTPKWSYTEVMQMYYENDVKDEDYRNNFGYTRATVWEIPHLSEDDIQRMKNTTSRALWPAVLEGKPKFGGGRIFSGISKNQVSYTDNDITHGIQESWPRLIGLDPAFTKDKYVAAWGAYDKARDCVYIYDWYVYDFSLSGPCSVMDHIPKLLSKQGNKIPIITDTKIKEKTLLDGSATITKYSASGLNMHPKGFKNPKWITKATGARFNDRSAGINEMYERMATDRLKVHADFKEFWDEFFTFAIDEKTGKPQITRDDCMDAVRYTVMSIIQDLGQLLNDSWGDLNDNEDYFYNSY